jgi:hypothetical protein
MSWYTRTLYFFCGTCRPNQSRTIRYSFPVILGALVVLGALSVTSTDKTIIEIVPSQTTVRAGETLALNVYVSAHKPVNAIDISVKVPSSQLKVKGIDTGESVITLWTEQPYVKNGVVYLRGGTFRKGFLGKHLIATINAEAIETGLAYVNVIDSMLLAGDGKATEIETANSANEEVKLYIATRDGVLPTDKTGSTFEASAEVNIITDIDGDGQVTLSDISQFMGAWRSRSVVYDFSGDGLMTFRDFAIILADSFWR